MRLDADPGILLKLEGLSQSISICACKISIIWVFFTEPREVQLSPVSVFILVYGSNILCLWPFLTLSYFKSNFLAVI